MGFFLSARPFHAMMAHARIWAGSHVAQQYHPGGGMRPRKRHGMQCAPVQKAPVHGFGDGPAPHPSTPDTRCAYCAHNQNRSLLQTVQNQGLPRRHAADWQQGLCATISRGQAASIDAIFYRNLPANCCDRRFASTRKRDTCTRHICVRACTQKQHAHAACCMIHVRDHKGSAISMQMKESWDRIP